MLQLISSGPVFCAGPEPSRFAVKMIWNSIQWEGNANAEIISPFSAGKPELSKVLFFSKARSKSEYSFACFAKCQELRVFNFVLPVHSASCFRYPLHMLDRVTGQLLNFSRISPRHDLPVNRAAIYIDYVTCAMFSAILYAVGRSDGKVPKNSLIYTKCPVPMSVFLVEFSYPGVCS